MTASYHLDYHASYDQIVLDASRRPVSGTARFNIAAEHMVTTAHSERTGRFDIEAVVTFHGDHTATITLDGSRSYHLDIETGSVSRG